MRYAYPVALEPHAGGRIAATFSDVPEALSDVGDKTEAPAEAADALVAAPAGHARERRPLPRPSTALDRDIVPVPPPAAGKLALCEAMRRQSISNSELARRLGVTEIVVRRLFDADHASRIERVHDARAVELIVEEVA